MATHGRKRGSLRERQAGVHSAEWYGDWGIENTDLTALCFSARCRFLSETMVFSEKAVLLILTQIALYDILLYSSL